MDDSLKLDVIIQSCFPLIRPHGGLFAKMIILVGGLLGDGRPLHDLLYGCFISVIMEMVHILVMVQNGGFEIAYHNPKGVVKARRRST